MVPTGNELKCHVKGVLTGQLTGLVRHLIVRAMLKPTKVNAGGGASSYSGSGGAGSQPPEKFVLLVGSYTGTWPVCRDHFNETGDFICSLPRSAGPNSYVPGMKGIFLIQERGQPMCFVKLEFVGTETVMSTAGDPGLYRDFVGSDGELMYPFQMTVVPVCDWQGYVHFFEYDKACGGPMKSGLYNMSDKSKYFDNAGYADGCFPSLKFVPKTAPVAQLLPTKVEVVQIPRVVFDEMQDQVRCALRAVDRMTTMFEDFMPQFRELRVGLRELKDAVHGKEMTLEASLRFGQSSSEERDSVEYGKKQGTKKES